MSTFDEPGEGPMISQPPAPLPATAEDGAWQPIETIPEAVSRNGTEVLLLVKFRAGIANRCLVGHFQVGGFCIEDHPAIAKGWYFWNGSMFDKASEPTHWMRLPELPAMLAHRSRQG